MRDEDDVLVPVVVAGGLDADTQDWLMSLEFPLMQGINGLAAGTGEPVWTGDYLADPRIPHAPEDDDAALRLGLRSLAAVPLRSPEGGIIGTLAISYRENHEFHDDELGLLKGLADHAAIALTNTSLYERLRESERRYRHLVQNSPDLVWSVDHEARLSFVSDTSERLTGFRPEELLGQHFGALIHESSREVARTDWTQFMSQPQQELRGRVNLLHRDGHPIPAEFTAMGTLDEEGRFAGANGSVRDIRDRDRMERDLRRQSAEIAAGEERAHLARELHDSVTQALFSMTLLARTVEMLLDREPERAKEQLAALRELQREALAEMRALIFELRPGNLEQDGLYKALKTHSAALQGRIGLPIVVKSELEDRLPITIEEVVYRIAQEALHNIVKHAAAHQVQLELARDGDGVRLRVIDDGKGFDPRSVPDGHLGLTGMRARAEKIGAHLTVESQPGAGTTISLTVPPEAIERGHEVGLVRRMEVASSAE
jgi:PAS domain S-box-containing protein